MTPGRRLSIPAVSTIATVVLLALVTRASFAQGIAQEPVMPASGPLVLTPIPTTVVFSPDAKVTTVNHSTATLTGAYLGKLYDDQLFLGVGGYWLANPRTDARLFYVGFIGGWRLYGGPRLKLSARARRCRRGHGLRDVHGRPRRPWTARESSANHQPPRRSLGQFSGD